MIEYHGISGVTASCVNAIHRLIQCEAGIQEANILTSGSAHGFLLITEFDDKIAIKTGFSSGYRGTGSSGFSQTIQLLHELDIHTEEYDVSNEFLERLDLSALTRQDIDWFESARPRRPQDLFRYVWPEHMDRDAGGAGWESFEPIIPLAIVDKRIADLAKAFRAAPDETLFRGFRRLEDTVRKRIASDRDGAKLFAEAFQDKASKLTWQNITSSEQMGRAHLFVGTYMAHRNPRCHKENDSVDYRDSLSEFLLLNHLFRLEAEAEPRLIDDCRNSSLDMRVERNGTKPFQAL